MDGLMEMRQAGILQKVRTHSPTVLSPMQVMEMATLGGARAMGQEKDLGSLEPGKKADLVILNPNPAEHGATHPARPRGTGRLSGHA